MKAGSYGLLFLFGLILAVSCVSTPEEWKDMVICIDIYRSKSMFKEKLINVGLTDHEAIVYNFLLEKGPHTAARIFNLLGISRATIYNVLDSLIAKGLVSTLDTERKKIFIPESPTMLLKMIEEKKRKLEDAQRALSDGEERVRELIPDLLLLHQSIKDKPRMRFFEGLEGIKSLADEFFQTARFTKEPIYEIFSEDELIKLNEKFGVGRAERDAMLGQIMTEGMQIYCFYTNRDKNHLMGDDFYCPAVHRHYVLSDLYPFRANITVCGNKIGLTSISGEAIGVLIENASMALTLKSFFRLALQLFEEVNSQRSDSMQTN
jgi:predicted transcriptional regulator